MADALTLSWTGSTLQSDFTRNGELAKAGGSGVPVSAPAQHGGDGSRWNPENLLTGALANCHMLTFLSLAAKAKVEVRGYEDRPQAVTAAVEGVTRVTGITLQPVIRVAPGTDPAQVEALFEKAHKYCVIANSIKAEIVMQPRVVEG